MSKRRIGILAILLADAILPACAVGASAAEDQSAPTISV
jgi:hypothetical protein